MIEQFVTPSESRLREKSFSRNAEQICSPLISLLLGGCRGVRTYVFDLRRMIELAAEKGPFNWLTILPIEEHGFYLNKTAFWNAIHMKYGWKLERMPDKCICGAQFSVKHALTCPRGSFTFIWHNEIRDLTANLLSEVCHGVQTEPDLQPLTDIQQPSHLARSMLPQAREGEEEEI